MPFYFNRNAYAQLLEDAKTVLGEAVEPAELEALEALKDDAHWLAGFLHDHEDEYGSIAADRADALVEEVDALTEDHEHLEREIAELRAQLDDLAGRHDIEILHEGDGEGDGGEPGGQTPEHPIFRDIKTAPDIFKHVTPDQLVNFALANTLIRPTGASAYHQRGRGLNLVTAGLAAALYGRGGPGGGPDTRPGDTPGTIGGGGGNDTIPGHTGGDTLSSGELGADALDGTTGADDIHGETGGDTLDTGELGADALEGTEGADDVHGETGGDTLDTGELGSDALEGTEGADDVHGDTGGDTLDTGELGSDAPEGTDGADDIAGDETETGDHAETGGGVILVEEPGHDTLPDPIGPVIDPGIIDVVEHKGDVGRPDGERRLRRLIDHYVQGGTAEHPDLMGQLAVAGVRSPEELLSFTAEGWTRNKNEGVYLREKLARRLGGDADRSLAAASELDSLVKAARRELRGPEYPSA